MTKNPIIGDIVEIPTSKGFAYAQFTHKQDQYGALLRVLDGTFDTRPKVFDEIVDKKHRFVTFFPLSAAIRRKIFFIVGHADVPLEAKEFPTFRAGAVGKNRKVATWWLWDGNKEWMIGDLTPKLSHLPIREIVNDTALIHRIESGYTPENDRFH
jgi:hypothetical protein